MYGATPHDAVIFAATAGRNSLLENTMKKIGVTFENTITFIVAAMRNSMIIISLLGILHHLPTFQRHLPNVKLSHYRPGQAQSVPGSYGSQIS